MSLGLVILSSSTCGVDALEKQEESSTPMLEEEVDEMEEQQAGDQVNIPVPYPEPAAWQTVEYFDLLKDKRVGVVANQTSTIGTTHLVDSLLGSGINVVKAFGPEHGFRGNVGAGDLVNDEVDGKTGVPIVSLYGKNKKPTQAQLEGLDVVLFDIQDVGARFYTYISSLHYVMEACAEANLEVMVLDRPNPNGHYVDGPVLDLAFSSFTGMHAIPIVHGMTMAEYAQMLNGEAWLKDGLQCKLSIVKCAFYDHSKSYAVPIAPSPNLPSTRSIELYPSICLFEGTQVSIGRGTDFPFEVAGVPNGTLGEFTFTPESRPGAAPHPKHEGKLCTGFDLRESGVQKGKLDLQLLFHMYNAADDKTSFFSPASFFDILAGSDKLRKDMLAGKTLEEIELSWAADLAKFRELRSKYLLYPDF